MAKKTLANLSSHHNAHLLRDAIALAFDPPAESRQPRAEEDAHRREMHRVRALTWFSLEVNYLGERAELVAEAQNEELLVRLEEYATAWRKAPRDA